MKKQKCWCSEHKDYEFGRRLYLKIFEGGEQDLWLEALYSYCYFRHKHSALFAGEFIHQGATNG